MTVRNTFCNNLTIHLDAMLPLYMFGTAIKCNRVSNLFEINKIKMDLKWIVEDAERKRMRSNKIRVTMAAKLENKMNDQKIHSHSRTRMTIECIMNSELTPKPIQVNS